MDVRCERCKTQYEIDDSRISETGVTVQCTTCHHVFVVKKKALVVTVPVKPGQTLQMPAMPAMPAAPGDTGAPPAGGPPPSGGPPPGLRPLSPPMSAPPPVTAGANPELPAQALPPSGAAAGAREWRIRQPSGNTFTFKDLTVLQKWIVERKVARDDEISVTGETWKRLGDIPELATFFQVVDEAQRAVVLQAQLASPQAAAPTAPRTPAPPPPETAPVERKGSKLPVILVALLALLGAGALGYYYLVVMPRPEDEALRAEAAARLEAERQEKDQQAQIRANQAAAEASLRADAGGTAGPSEDGGALAGAPGAGDGGPSEDAGTAQDAGAGGDAGLDAGLVDAGTVRDAGPADAGLALDGGAGPKKPAPVRDFDYWVAQGDRLRDRERPQQALDAYAQAAELEPDRAEPYAGRGFAYLDLGEPVQAETEFKQSLKINANYGDAIMGLAETYRSQGKKAEAIRYYERYLAVLPNGPEAPVARTAIERLKE